MTDTLLNKTVEFTLNNHVQIGKVVRLGVYNANYVVVDVGNNSKRENLRWVKIENCKVIE